MGEQRKKLFGHPISFGLIGAIFAAMLLIIACSGDGGGGVVVPPAPPAADLYEINSQYLQYRSFEDANSNRYQGWLEITKNGAPAQETDVDEILMTDSAGNTIIPITSGSYQYASMFYDCTVSPCTESGPLKGLGYGGRFDNLPADTYQFEVMTVDGQTVTASVVYDGRLELPVVASATMQSKWLNGDLVLSWTNPTGDANWAEVDQLRIVIYDSGGMDVLPIATDTLTETVTVPASLLSQAAGLGSGALARWEVQTRAYDANGMNYARGYSNRIGLSYAINAAYLQYRNYENSANNRYAAWIGVVKDGAPAEASDVTGFQVTGSAGNAVTPTNSGFYRSSPYYYYNCSTTPCTQQGDIIDSGFSASFADLPADDYQIEVEAADGQQFFADVKYTGQLVLPFVSSSTMQSQLVNGDLVLSWTNPTSEANWAEVDQFRIIVLAADGTEVIYIRANPTDETLTIPASLVSEAANLGHGALTNWQIQTRALDANGMNFARGFSNTIPISLAIYASYLQYRNYENPANNRYAAYIGVNKDGAPAQDADFAGFQITGSAGNLLTPSSSGFVTSSPYYYYNCSTTPCTQRANIIDSGFWANFDDLSADDYQIEVEAADGQKVTADVTYTGKLVLPFVVSTTMQSQLSNGDLVLSWTNPIWEANWFEVDQYRIIILAADGAEVIYIRANPGDNTVTVPASLVSEAENLGHGPLANWQIQTRGIDANGMNFARGFSNTIPF